VKQRLPWVLIGLLPLFLLPVSSELGDLGGDSAQYILLARALAGGQGYRELWTPGLPTHGFYPPMFPALLVPAELAGAAGFLAHHLTIALCALGCVALTALLFVPHVGVAGALAAAALLGGGTFFVLSLLRILSEVPFLLFTLGALLALQRFRSAGGGARSAALCGALVGAAWLTRSAGIAVFAALVPFVLARRRLAPIALFIGCALAPVAVWTVAGGGGYLGQLLAKNPYDPTAGQATAADLAQRVSLNARFYAAELPARLVAGWLPRPVGWGVLALLAAGLALMLRGPTRPFALVVGAQAALLLVWPWADPRFLLPVLPFLVLALLLPFRNGKPLIAAAAVLGAVQLFGDARLLTAHFRDLDFHPPPGMGETIRFARWFDAHTWGQQSPAAVRVFGRYIALARRAREVDGEAVLLCRKPTIAAVLGGVKAAAYPFTRDPDRAIREIEARGRALILEDEFDPLTREYLGAALRGHPERFETVAHLGATRLLRLRPAPAAR
jgi:hypothetical protein